MLLHFKTLGWEDLGLVADDCMEESYPESPQWFKAAAVHLGKTITQHLAGLHLCVRRWELRSDTRSSSVDFPSSFPVRPEQRLGIRRLVLQLFRRMDHLVVEPSDLYNFK